jgi:hypothetical protein
MFAAIAAEPVGSFSPACDHVPRISDSAKNIQQ